MSLINKNALHYTFNYKKFYRGKICSSKSVPNEERVKNEAGEGMTFQEQSKMGRVFNMPRAANLC